MSHETDMQKVSDFLKGAAIRHELCDAIFAEVDVLNEQLEVPLDVRQNRSFEVTVQVKIILDDAPSFADSFCDRSPELWILDGIERRLRTAADGCSYALASTVNIQEWRTLPVNEQSS